MNVQRFTRIDLVYLEEAVLAVLFEVEENAERTIRQADICKRMGIHPYVNKASWIIYGILTELETEERVLAHHDASNRSLGWEFSDNEG